MSRLAFLGEHEALTPPRNDDKKCRIYFWIGQSLCFCDNCGEPFWTHPYQLTSKPELFVKHYITYQDIWEWTPVSIITAKHAEYIKNQYPREY